MAIEFETKQVDENGKEIKPKKTKLQKFASFLLVMSIILTALLTLLAAAPIAIVLLGFVSALLLVAIVLLTTVCTVGLIWFSDKMRNFIGQFGDFVGKCFSLNSDVLKNLKYITPYVFIIGLVFIVAGLIIDITMYRKLKENPQNPYKKKMILEIIFAGIFAVASIVAFISCFSYA